MHENHTSHYGHGQQAFFAGHSIPFTSSFTCISDLRTNIYKSDFRTNIYKIQWVRMYWTLLVKGQDDLFSALMGSSQG